MFLKTFLPVRSRFLRILKASFEIHVTMMYGDVFGLLIDSIYHINCFWDYDMFDKSNINIYLYVNLNISQTHGIIIIVDVTSINFTSFFIFRRAVFKKQYPSRSYDIRCNYFGNIRQVIWRTLLCIYIYTAKFCFGTHISNPH